MPPQGDRGYNFPINIRETSQRHKVWWRATAAAMYYHSRFVGRIIQRIGPAGSSGIYSRLAAVFVHATHPIHTWMCGCQNKVQFASQSRKLSTSQINASTVISEAELDTYPMIHE